MKKAKILKDEEFRRQAEALLLELLGRVPFLKVRRIRRECAVAEQRADWLVELEAGGRDCTLVVEGLMQGQPRNVLNARLLLQNILGKAHGKPYYGVMVAPFLSAESACLCTESGLGYADLAGNALLSFDHVYIERQAAGNPFRERRLLRSLFTAKAERVLRILLTPPLRAWKVVELVTAAGVSLGQVSNVRKLLIDRQWAVAESGGLRVSKPEELARDWQASYAPRPLSRTSAYTLLHGHALEEAIRAALAEADSGAHAVLASYSAAAWYAPYARQATRFFYADKQGVDVLKRHLKLQPVERGENIVIFEPREDDVFAGRVEASPGLWCSGLVQTWLDVSAGGERGAEAADHLMREKLLPAWKGGTSS
ncbi:MAG: hypothetical protein WCK89_05845 [bacterium]